MYHQQRGNGITVRDEHWSRLDRLDQDWSQFWPDQDWIGLQFFWKLSVQDWIGLRKFLLYLCDYSEHIKNFSCDPIFADLLNASIFCHEWQRLCWENFAIRTVSTFVHITLRSTSNANTVQWLVSVYTCYASVCWFCSHHLLWLS